MASSLFSTPAVAARSTAQYREASAHRPGQQFCGRIDERFSKPAGARATRLKLPSSRSTSTISAIHLRRCCSPGVQGSIAVRSPLRSRRFLETYEPKLRLVEDETSYKLIAAVPGVGADDVTLSVTDDGLLKVDARRTDGREMVNRTLRLAPDADLTTVDAICADGILEVTIGKVQPPEPVSVPVSASEPPATSDLYALTKKLPGIAASEVQVTLEALHVERSTQSYQLVIHATSANGYGEFHFAQTLPEDIIPETTTAFCSNGLLHVRIPRREPLRVSVPVASVDETSTEEEQLQLAKFQAPGYSAEQVFLWAMPGCLRVQFKRDGKETAERLVVLPDEVDLDSIRAVCVDGVLTVKVAKSALRQTETRQVVVSAERS